MNSAPAHTQMRFRRKSVVWLLVLWFGMFWGPSVVPAGETRVGGFLQLDKRFTVGGDSVTIADFYNRFRLEVSRSLGEQLDFFSSIDLRFYDLPRSASLKDLEELNRQFPTDLSLWEAYVNIYGLFSSHLDLRVGKQRISWGTADKLNPTDNLNPDDFSDLVNFSEKIPTWALKATYYMAGATLTAVWLPHLTPVLLPRRGAALFLGFTLSGFQDSLHLPSASLRNSMFAFKVRGSLGKWDLSASYFKGYDDIPVLKSMRLFSPLQSLPAGEIALSFPAVQVVGMDFASEIGGAGIWGEGALVFPKKIYSRTLIGDGEEKTLQLDDQPYLKFTLGGDYSFSGGWYVNSQWMHGFFTERGGRELHDYFFSRIDKKLLQGNVTISLGGVLEVPEWSNLNGSYGFGMFPEISYQGIDNLTVKAGGFFVEGKTPALLGQWRKADQVYMQMKVSF